MNDKNKNLLVRILSAGVLLPLILWMVALGGWAFAIFIAIAGALTVSEYYTITLGRLTVPAIVGCLGIALVPLATEYLGDQTPRVLAVLPGTHLLERIVPQLALVGALILLVVFLFAWIFQLFTGNLKDAPIRVGHVVAGFAYVGFGMGALAAIRLTLPSGLVWLIAALVITWANDTLAYFAGRLFGKRKLAPTVSPNKTWEGFFGGLVGSIGGLFIMKLVFPEFRAIDCVLLGALGAFFGPMGDLCESMLKRAYGVKDSSKLIPGHGGFLDRIDALLFNAPVTFVYAAAALYL